jgi:hypothetical protein
LLGAEIAKHFLAPQVSDQVWDVSFVIPFSLIHQVLEFGSLTRCQTWFSFLRIMLEWFNFTSRGGFSTICSATAMAARN